MAINIPHTEIKEWAIVLVNADRIANARLVAAAMDPDTGGAKTFDNGECGTNGVVTHYIKHIPVLNNMDVSAIQKAYPDTLRIYSDDLSLEEVLKQHGLGRIHYGDKYTE